MLHHRYVTWNEHVSFSEETKLSASQEEERAWLQERCASGGAASSSPAYPFICEVSLFLCLSRNCFDVHLQKVMFKLDPAPTHAAALCRARLQLPPLIKLSCVLDEVLTRESSDFQGSAVVCIQLGCSARNAPSTPPAGILPDGQGAAPGATACAGVPHQPAAPGSASPERRPAARAHAQQVRGPLALAGMPLCQCKPWLAHRSMARAHAAREAI